MKKFRRLFQEYHTDRFQEFVSTFKDVVRNRYGINYTPEGDNVISAQKLVHGNYFIRGMNFVISMYDEEWDDGALLIFDVEVADEKIWSMEMIVDEPWYIDLTLDKFENTWRRDLENVVL